MNTAQETPALHDGGVSAAVRRRAHAGVRSLAAAATPVEVLAAELSGHRDQLDAVIVDNQVVGMIERVVMKAPAKSTRPSAAEKRCAAYSEQSSWNT